VNKLVREVVEVLLTAVNKATAPIEQFRNQLRGINSISDAVTHSMDKTRSAMLGVRGAFTSVGTTTMGFFDTLTLGYEEWRMLNKQGTQWVTAGGRIANQTRLLTHGMRGFRMELLGVMFFGMGIQRFN